MAARSVGKVLMGVAVVGCGALGAAVVALEALWERYAAAAPPASAVPGLVDLGVVRLPADTSAPVRSYAWKVPERAQEAYLLGYGLDPALEQRLVDFHQALGTKWRYRPLGEARFTYRPPPGCEKDMRCVYDVLARQNEDEVEALGSRFAAYASRTGLDDQALASLVLGFVQRIRYEIPADQPFGVLPPALVAQQDRGDCDSKAVLAVMLLRQVGLDAVMLSSDRLAHAAVGVALPGPGPVWRHRGVEYRYAEVTTAGWPLGMMPPQHNMPRLWSVIPLGETDADPDDGPP